MGWKSTITVKRAEAIEAIALKLFTLDEKTNTELGNILEELGFGDDPDLKWFGRNFIVED